MIFVLFCCHTSESWPLNKSGMVHKRQSNKCLLRKVYTMSNTKYLPFLRSIKVDRFDDPCFGHAPTLLTPPHPHPTPYSKGGWECREREVKDLQLSSQHDLTVRLESSQRGRMWEMLRKLEKMGFKGWNSINFGNIALSSFGNNARWYIQFKAEFYYNNFKF